MIHPNFVIIGALIQFFGSWSYLAETIKGKVKPNRVTWLLWSIAPLVAFSAQIQQGVGINSLTTFIVGFVPLIIFIASFINKKAEWKLGKLDITCGVLSLLGLILWYTTQVGNIAILFSILADGLAALPTLVKSYKYPETENDSVFIAGVINAGIGIFAIQQWRFEYYSFPVYLLLINLALAALIRFKLGKNLKLGNLRSAA